MSPSGFRSLGWTSKVVASGVLLVLVAALVFPLFARSYAASEAKLAVERDRSSSSDSKDDSRIEGLGVRSLPLLSGDARDALAEDPEAAVDEKAAAVFGEGWDEVRATAAAYLQDGATSLVPDPSQPYVGYSYGSLDDAVAEHIKTNKSEDIVDLASMLLIRSADQSVDGSNELAVTAYSLLATQATSTKNCDVQVDHAFALSLRWAVDREGRDAEYAKAVEMCAGDATPAFAMARDHLFDAFDTGCEDPDLGEIDALEPVLAEFKQLQSTYPSSPAGFVGEAETRLAQARQAQLQGQRPFWVKQQFGLAGELFAKAVRLSSDDDLILGEAAALLGVGDVAAAAERVEALVKSGSLSPYGRGVAARIAAANGEYADALQLQKLATQKEVTLLERAGYRWPDNSATSFTGLGGATALQALVFGGGCGSSLVRDQAFVPEFRAGADDAFRSLLVEYSFLAKKGAPVEECSEPSTDAMTCAAIAAASGDDQRASELTSSAGGNLGDTAQNLWRRYGELKEAESAAIKWTEQEPDSANAHDRLGEVYFLQKKYKSAEASFRRATDLFAGYAEGDGNTMSGPGWASLRWAASLEALGRHAEARAALEGALQLQVEAESALSLPTDSLGVLEMHIQTLNGQIDYADKKFADAIDDMKAAIVTGEAYESAHAGGYVLRGVQAQVASAAALQLNDLEEARRFAKQAVDLDPASPIFRETLAESRKQGGGREQAIASYRAAVSVDETLFSSWNNLGVLLGQRGDVAGAVEAFRHALQARPDYAVAWFNYGAMRAEQGGISGFVASQGALGKAARLDSSLRDATPVLLFDEKIYDSDLDVSRAIPKDWKLAQSVRGTTSSITLMVLLVILVRVGWALGLDRIVGAATERGLRAGSHQRSPMRRFDSLRPHPVWMTGICVAVLLWLVGVLGALEGVVVGVVIVALLAAHLIAPSFEAGQGIAHASWMPASALSVVLGLVGLGFTPPAVLSTKSSNTWVRWSGPAILGGLTALFITVAWLTGVPSTRAVASAGMMVISSALVPVAPLDGARLSVSRSVDLAITGALAAGTVIFAAGWI